MPVFVLPDVHLFPGCMLPLFVFEDRYRQLLAHALRSHRMFCIGNREGDDEKAPISPYSTAGLVRCCVKQGDGTSHLLLLGLQRIRIKKWLQERPFPIAAVEPLATVSGNSKKMQGLKARALGLFKLGGEAAAKELRAALEKNEDAEQVCDVLSYHFTRCPKLQQKLLGERSLEKRYEMLIAALETPKRD